MELLQTVSREIEFDAAHRLLDSPESKCFNLHGHRYKCIATVSGFLDQKGYIIDFGTLKQILMDEVHDPLDHKFVNFITGDTNATAENMIEWIWPRVAFKVAEQKAILTKIELYETPTCKATREVPLAYLAGMLDADGNISQSGNIEIQLRVSNIKREMLESLADDFGCGTIQDAGGGNGPVKGNFPCFSWVVPRRSARIICALLLPFLRIKRAQAELCVEYGRYETGRARITQKDWEHRAKVLTDLSKANGHNRIFTAEDMLAQQNRFRENRRRSARKSYHGDEND